MGTWISENLNWIIFIMFIIMVLTGFDTKNDLNEIKSELKALRRQIGKED